MINFEKEYILTDDGFGVHTFELNRSIKTKNFKEYYSVLKHVYSSGCRIHTIERKREIQVFPKGYKGMRMYVYRMNEVWGIRIIVTPRVLLDKNASPISILTSRDNMKELERILNYVIFDTFGGNYSLGSFHLSRIDCCVNVMLSKSYSAERYIKLIRRSVMYNSQDHIERYESDDPNADEKNKHSFRLYADGLTFTAYDKYFQLEDREEEYESVSDSMLRLEISLKRHHIEKEILENDLRRNIKVIEHFVESSKEIFKDFVKIHFCKGDYYCYSFMVDIIAASDRAYNIKNRMLKFAKDQYNYESFMDIKKKVLNEIGVNKYGTMIKAFKKLEISPISLPYRDQHGQTMIPGLYSLLRLGKERIV